MQNDLLIDYAKEGQFSIADAAAALDYPLSTVYDHATSLVSSGALKRSRVGKTFYYSLKRKPKALAEAAKGGSIAAFSEMITDAEAFKVWMGDAYGPPHATKSTLQPPHTPSMDWGYKVFAAACLGLLAWAAIGGR